MYDLELNLQKVERAFLVGVTLPRANKEDASAHLEELELLVENLDIEIAGREMVNLRKKSARFLIGSGKAEEIVNQSRMLDADLIVFDEVLSPSQQRNWEQAFKVFAIDRAEVILDVFSQRARTREARLQIQLAREKYSLPRLTNAWTHLSRQFGGGTGQRGVGEKQIELDRRHVSKNISKLETELKNVRNHRKTQRKKREKSFFLNAAIVGYTNAGKSTLLNKVSGSDIFVADKLFATLDPSTRPVVLPNNQKLLLTDTVGFIHKLPHLLIESFKATLEEAVFSDFLIHVVDANSSYVSENFDTTVEVLNDIGASGKRTLQVFNKVDLIDDNLKRTYIINKYPEAIFTSFKTGEGVEILMEKVAEILSESLSVVKLKIPHKRSDIISFLHRTSDIQSEEYVDNCVVMNASISPPVYKEVSSFVV